MNILIVDDEPQNLTLFEAILKLDDYGVTSAQNGVEALALLRENPIDLIISDILMPEMDGFQLLRECKKDPALKEIPFAFCTATYTEPKDREFAMSLGVDRFLMKPLEPKLLLLVVREMLSEIPRTAAAKPEISPEDETTYLVEHRNRLIKQLEKEMTNLESTNRELKESERRYRSIFENAKEGIFQATPDGRYRSVNPSFARMFGFDSPQEMVRSITDTGGQLYVNRGDREELKRLLDEQGSVAGFEVQVYRKDRSIFWVSINAHAVRGPDGTPLYWEGTNEDITARKETELALQKSEEKYRSIFENAVEGMFETLPEGRFISVNPAMAHMHGFGSPEEMMTAITDIGRQLFVNPEDRRRYRKILEEDGVVSDFEAKVCRKDGGVIWASTSARALVDDAGKIVRFAGTTEDITARKVAEEQLKLERQKFSILSENVPFGMVMIDREGNFIYTNPKFREIFSYDLSDIPDGRTWFRKVYPDAEKRRAVIARWLSDLEGAVTGLQRSAVFAVTCGDGTEKIINFITVQLEAGIQLTSCEDITARVLAEKSLQQTMEKLRRSLVGTIQAISLIVETRDPYTAGHQKRVSSLARTIAQEMGLPRDAVDNIRMAGAIHDIGKLSVPAEILSKPTRLNEIEMSLIKVHPQTGYDILKDAELPSPVAEIVLQHHESLDGSGYPQGLKDGEILLEARIVSVADVVEAIASHRPYRPALGIEMALEEIEKNKGRLYDAEVVGVCLKLFREKGFSFGR